MVYTDIYEKLLPNSNYATFFFVKVEYARVRGVKIVPEFDAPAHVGNGWQYAEEKHPEWGRLAVCVNKEDWQDFAVEPPAGQVCT